MSERQNLVGWMKRLPRWVLVAIVIVVAIPVHILMGMVSGVSDGIAELKRAMNVDK